MCLNVFECIIYKVQQSDHLYPPWSTKQATRTEVLLKKNALALFYYATRNKRKKNQNTTLIPNLPCKSLPDCLLSAWSQREHKSRAVKRNRERDAGGVRGGLPGHPSLIIPFADFSVNGICHCPIQVFNLFFFPLWIFQATMNVLLPGLSVALSTTGLRCIQWQARRI